MKVESYVLLFVGIFFGIVGAVYWLWSHEDARQRHASRDVPSRLRARFLLPVVVAAHAPEAVGRSRGLSRGRRRRCRRISGQQHLAVRPRSRRHLRGPGVRIRSLDARSWAFPGRRGPRRGRLREPARRPGLARAGPAPGIGAGVGTSSGRSGGGRRRPSRIAKRSTNTASTTINTTKVPKPKAKATVDSQHPSGSW